MGLLLINRVLGFDIQGLDVFPGWTRIGKNMGAVVALAEIPDFAIIAVRNLDVVCAQAGSIECPCFMGFQ